MSVSRVPIHLKRTDLSPCLIRWSFLLNATRRRTRTRTDVNNNEVGKEVLNFRKKKKKNWYTPLSQPSQVQACDLTKSEVDLFLFAFSFTSGITDSDINYNYKVFSLFIYPPRDPKSLSKMLLE